MLEHMTTTKEVKKAYLSVKSSKISQERRAAAVLMIPNVSPSSKDLSFSELKRLIESSRVTIQLRRASPSCVNIKLSACCVSLISLNVMLKDMRFGFLLNFAI